VRSPLFGRAGLHSALESAFRTASRHLGSVVLLGVRPRSPHRIWLDRAWRAAAEDSTTLFEVRSFCEKPSDDLAIQLFDRGALWNTFVMVGHVRAFLDMVGAARTGLLRPFRRIASGQAPKSTFQPGFMTVCMPLISRAISWHFRFGASLL